jgi:hypothetical protein
MFSVAGLLYILFALAFYIVFFPPNQQTPDADYYMLILAVFGSVFAFLVTLSVSARANRAVHFPFLVRLPSRIEYLTAVLIASMSFTFIVQIVLGFLAVIANGPDLTLTQLLEIPPIWISGVLLFTVLALHASDLVASGWSRVYVFGILAVLLYIQSGLSLVAEFLSQLLDRAGSFLLTQGWTTIADPLFAFSDWITSTGSDILQSLTRLVFWPFSAVADASIAGFFTLSQALAPAVLVLYATALFVLAASVFAIKDLYLTE